MVSWLRRRAGAELGERRLQADDTLRLAPRGDELLVRVSAGSVLLTQEGDQADHVLEAGEELRLRRRGLAVAWALAPSRLTVAAGRPAGAARPAAAAVQVALPPYGGAR